MTALLQSAYLEIGKGNLRPRIRSTSRLDGAQIVADAMSVLENGKVLIFERRVKVNTDARPAQRGGRRPT